MAQSAVFFGLRFDFRNPSFAGTTMADRYAAGLDMVEWADRLGCLNVTISEHHASADGYLPSPVPMLAAMAARTSNVRLLVAALLAPFHDPLRLAEDMVVLDHLSRGRIDILLGGGYVREEFAMFDVPMKERPKRVTHAVTTLKAAFTGEPFEYLGRTVQVTPAPFRSGGPAVLLGGNSEPAARRAARIADGFLPAMPAVWEFYRDEVLRLGRPDPGSSPVGENRVVALAKDPEEGWERMGPYFLHETNAYGVWQAQDDLVSPYRSVSSLEELRAAGQYAVLTPEQLVEELRAAPFPFVNLHPLCGGIPPELAWSSLHLFEHEVLPVFAPSTTD
ncbi:luciferase [Parafrankia colletiae]|uniref:Luciferase n=1 Tax=Parafrankia colletiae TaxID=573497 RepID=A0A1S1QNS9_9ACTN|nr:LLM class flavin-dependent oxidoreductase [Parafrankia colletiae]MCK9902092.1 LLM class flavin-dependent oxidoreductase [Frankia sp. Cpl3]OHV34915.1 luciferase [Parafrankia colletiae]